MLEIFSQASRNNMLTENLYKLWVSGDFIFLFFLLIAHLLLSRTEIRRAPLNMFIQSGPFQRNKMKLIFNSLYLIHGAHTSPFVAYFANNAECEQREIIS